ncbi:MAG TPA: 2'-5' RNA ligase family protein, partial [Candidatus Limnocylindria bacterium]
MREAWRCFVGVPVGPTLRTDLETSVELWRARQNAPDLRWTDPDGWHVTIAFLGATDPSVIPDLVNALGVVADGTDAFPLPTGGLGAFPRPG